MAMCPNRPSPSIHGLASRTALSDARPASRRMASVDISAVPTVHLLPVHPTPDRQGAGVLVSVSGRSPRGNSHANDRGGDRRADVFGDDCVLIATSTGRREPAKL